jgi:hypothetical protein
MDSRGLTGWDVNTSMSPPSWPEMPAGQRRLRSTCWSSLPTRLIAELATNVSPPFTLIPAPLDACS